MFSSKAQYDHVLDRSTTIEGTLQFAQRLLLKGTVRGALVGDGPDSLVVLEGTVIGPVTVHEVFIEGSVEGDVTAHAVTIRAKGTVRGKIQTDVLHLLEGGQLDGEVRMTPKAHPASITDLPRRNGSAQAAKDRLQQVTSPRHTQEM